GKIRKSAAGFQAKGLAVRALDGARRQRRRFALRGVFPGRRRKTVEADEGQAGPAVLFLRHHFPARRRVLLEDCRGRRTFESAGGNQEHGKRKRTLRGGQYAAGDRAPRGFGDRRAREQSSAGFRARDLHGKGQRERHRSRAVQPRRRRVDSAFSEIGDQRFEGRDLRLQRGWTRARRAHHRGSRVRSVRERRERKSDRDGEQLKALTFQGTFSGWRNSAKKNFRF